MRAKICFVAMLGLGIALAAPAYAQDSTTGAVRGQIKDKDTGEAVIGATVVATSPVLQGSQANITDDGGGYFLPNLPPGMYIVTVYYMDAEFARDNVLVQLGKTAKVNIQVSSDAGKGETIAIKGSAPIIDQASTKTGLTITQDYTKNLPTGRTFADVLGASAGSQGDTFGTSFGGSTSVENTYIVDGLNTTDPGLGTVASNLPNEFVQETEVITGGYKAEYGRATGGIVNIVTKSGSNQFSGSVFANWEPGSLRAAERATPSAASSIDVQDELDNAFDFGAELGGPILKDRLWFHVGLNPTFNINNRHRLIKSQMDEDGDGEADVDENGFTKFTDPLAKRTIKERRQRYFYTAKLTGALSPDHQGTLSMTGNPRKNETAGGLGSAGSVTGELGAGRVDTERNVMDGVFKWTSKFFDSNTQFDLVAGAHKESIDESPHFAEGNNMQVRYDSIQPLGFFEASEGVIPVGCEDESANDLYRDFTNCPVQNYRTGGVGLLEDNQAKRLSAKLDFTQRFPLLGRHTFKTGADIEQNSYDRDIGYSGGSWTRQLVNGNWNVRNYFGITDDGSEPCGVDADGDKMLDARCERADVLNASTTTRNISAYVQDDWAVLPNLVFNAGLRWEQQQVFVADEIAGQISFSTGERIPSMAFDLRNMLAPRLGVIYDPTQEGRSRLFGSWGRFYESMPMDINVRAFGGEVQQTKTLFNQEGCDPTGGSQEGCMVAGQPRFLGSSDAASTPNLRAQYLDELVIGSEYELLPDFKIGASYSRRELGRIIEDVSNDGGTTYIIANPGVVDTQGIRDLRAEAEEIRANTGDMDLQKRLGCDASGDPVKCMNARAEYRDFTAGQFERVGEFDAPNRTYNAITLTAEKRFSKAFFMNASYTYSKLRGNYPGLFSPDTGQLDPNLTSMYDLPQLMANRYGDLSHDTPHLLKVDGYYTLDAGSKVGSFTFGGTVRAASGMPHSALGAHVDYGDGESFILPRGTVVELEDGRRVGRSPATARFDARLKYGRPLGKGTTLEAFVDLVNLFNMQAEEDIDQDYTFDNVNPIVGGDSKDLRHLKVVGDDGGGTSALATQNPNYGNVNDRFAPFSARFGMRLSF